VGRTVAVFDLDGTITRRDAYLGFLLFYLRHHPRRWHRALMTAAAGALFGVGFLGHDAMKRTALRLVLGGAERSHLERWSARFVDRQAAALVRPGALTRIAAHRRAGDELLLATASLDLYAEPLAQRLGFTCVVSTRAAWTADARISGELEGGNLRGAQKLAAIEKALANNSGDEAAFVIAYADHHSDLPLLRWADRGVAVNPTARLARAAWSEGLPVEDWERP
jgi:HAD superfamily hydrolase (TIGR01490 family)